MLRVHETIQQQFPAPLAGALERFLLLDELDALYRKVLAGDPNELPFERLLKILKVRVQIAPADLGHIPVAGPAILVANHPFGFLEGCVMAAILPRLRPDVKIMANSLLSAFPGLSDQFIFVNPFGGGEAARENRRGLRAALDHLRTGGLLVVFPAGEVAHLDWKQRGIVDPPWNAGVAGLSRLSGASVVPAFFAGSNSALFQIAGLLHPKLRTALLPHEFLSMQDRSIEVRIGSPISAGTLVERFATDEQRIGWIRRRAYVLQHRGPSRATPRLSIPNPFARREPVCDPVPVPQIELEIAALPSERRLSGMGELAVYCASSHEIPSVLREIGRLREITFRGVGEGTCKQLDIDPFDAHYIHLFIWNGDARQIVGAYRLAPADEICRTHGISGLYTSTLFRYDETLLGRLPGNAVELGRSFVRLEYQKSYTPLLLLWKGIAAWMVQNPRYSVLFGPVSISNDYTPVSRQLLVSYFSQHDRASDLACLVRARNPFRRNPLRRKDDLEVWDIEELSAVIGDIETNGKGVPVLLRQYLKLGGKLIGFNVDHAFAGCLDGLIVVDLRATDRRTLERFMGKAEAARFLSTTPSDTMSAECQVKVTDSRGGTSSLARSLLEQSRRPATAR